MYVVIGYSRVACNLDIIYKILILFLTCFFSRDCCKIYSTYKKNAYILRGDDRMTEFDSFLLSGILLSAVSFFLSLVGEKKRKMAIVALVVFLIITLLSIFLAYKLGWESSILHIPESSNAYNSDEQIPETEPVDDISTQQSTVPEPTQNNNTEVFLGEAYEFHTPNDGITASVEFRKWDSNTDKDLRDITYTDASGMCLYSWFSNMFNSIGGGGAESDRILSEIHIPINVSANVDVGNLYLVGSIISAQDTEGSSAYADVAILVNGVEKWRNENRITSTTVQPVDFVVSLEDLKSEVIIQTSCVPLDDGLALGYVDLEIVCKENLDVEPPSIQNNPSDNESLFVRAFESHSPNNNGVDFVEFRGWDSFSDADLRTEQYINKDGLFIMFSNTFSALGSSIENQIVSEIHLVINPEKNLDGLVWSGMVVAEQRTLGSSAYANVSILVDGVEKWRTTDAITGNTIAPVEFSVDLSDALYEVIIKTNCTPNQNGLALGFVNMDFNYS